MRLQTGLHLFDDDKVGAPGGLEVADLCWYPSRAIKDAVRLCITPETSERRAVRQKGFGEERLLASVLQGVHGSKGDAFSFGITPLRQEDLSARLVHQGAARAVLEVYEHTAG